MRQYEQLHIEYWASTTIKIMVDPIPMMDIDRVQQWWLYKSTHSFNGLLESQGIHIWSFLVGVNPMDLLGKPTILGNLHMCIYIYIFSFHPFFHPPFQVWPNPPKNTTISTIFLGWPLDAPRHWDLSPNLRWSKHTHPPSWTTGLFFVGGGVPKMWWLFLETYIYIYT